MRLSQIKMACSLKTADPGEKRIEIWSMFDLVVFQVFLGPFGVLVSHWLVA